MKTSNRIFKQLVVLFVAVVMASCGASNYEKFNEAMARGELLQAQGYLEKIDDRTECKNAALQLIRAYIEVDDINKAIHVYENITPWHKNRYKMKFSNSDYEKTVCKLLRDYLVKHGEYERAWEYYPLEYEDENYFGNAQCRFAYISDVVVAMCAKSEHNEARVFMENQLRWFVTYIDSSSSKYAEDVKNNFSSAMVREKLLELINNAY